MSGSRAARDGYVDDEKGTPDETPHFHNMRVCWSRDSRCLEVAILILHLYSSDHRTRASRDSEVLRVPATLLYARTWLEDREEAHSLREVGLVRRAQRPGAAGCAQALVVLRQHNPADPLPNAVPNVALGAQHDDL